MCPLEEESRQTKTSHRDGIDSSQAPIQEWLQSLRKIVYRFINAGPITRVSLKESTHRRQMELSRDKCASMLIIGVVLTTLRFASEDVMAFMFTNYNLPQSDLIVTAQNSNRNNTGP